MKRQVYIFSLAVLFVPLFSWASWGISSEVAHTPYAQKDALSDRDRLFRLEKQLHELASRFASPDLNLKEARNQISQLNHEILGLKAEIKRLQLTDQVFQKAMREQMTVHLKAVQQSLSQKIAKSDDNVHVKRLSKLDKKTVKKIQSKGASPTTHANNLKKNDKIASHAEVKSEVKAKENISSQSIALTPSDSDKIVVAFE